MRYQGINSLPTLCGCVGTVSSGFLLNKPLNRSSELFMSSSPNRREPDSGLGYTQDCQSQWRTAEEERGAKGRLAGDRIPEITSICRNSQWHFPRRQALFTSDRTYSITSESDTPAGYVDRPAEA